MEVEYYVRSNAEGLRELPSELHRRGQVLSVLRGAHGKAEYIEETFACIYGPPPMERLHKCNNCGYAWETHKMIDEERFCPKCGDSAPYEENKEGFFWN